MRPLGFGIALGVLLAGSPALAERAVPADLVRYPVLVSFEKGPAATGFYVNNEAGEAFFVSARHILFHELENGAFRPKGNKILLLSYPQEEEINDAMYLELELEKLYAEGNARLHETSDVAVIRLGQVMEGTAGKSLTFVPGVVQKVQAGKSAEGTLLGASPDLIRRYADISVGNEVFVFGYPLSLGLANYPQIDYSRPLLRRGAVAGKNDEKQTVIIDCPTVYGNSGGPVIEAERISLTETRFWVIGVVSEFIPFDDRWYTRQTRAFGSGIENSGYSVVIPMDRVLELLEMTSAEEAAAAA